MGNPAWSTSELFRDARQRTKHQHLLKPRLQEWIATWRVMELFHAGQEQRLCFAPVLTMAQLATQEQLHARRFFVDVTHPRAGTLTHLGAPYQLHEPWWRIRRPAPLLGEHNDEVKASLAQDPVTGTVVHSPFQVVDAQPPTPHPQSPPSPLPLKGVRVADFRSRTLVGCGRVHFVPYTSRILAQR